MNDRELYEKASQAYSRLADLFHKLADSGGDKARQDQLWEEISQIQRSTMPAVVGVWGPEILQPDPQKDWLVPPTSVGESGPVLHDVPAGTVVSPLNPSGQPSPGGPSEPTQSAQTKYGRPHWIGGWLPDPHDEVHRICLDDADELTTLIIYNIPGRDNGNYSAGGAKDSSAYYRWIKRIVEAVPVGKQIRFVLEPDALGLSRSLPDWQKTERKIILQNALATLNQVASALVYIDASTWVPRDEMVELLRPFVPLVDGFSSNVSGFESTTDVMAWADPIAKAIGLKYLVDTSRNGNGQPHPGKWCNPTRIAPGVEPTAETGNPLCAGFFHGKLIGESDGKGINDDGSHPRDDVPAAGEWFQDYYDAAISGVWEPFEAKYDV